MFDCIYCTYLDGKIYQLCDNCRAKGEAGIDPKYLAEIRTVKFLGEKIGYARLIHVACVLFALRQTEIDNKIAPKDYPTVPLVPVCPDDNSPRISTDLATEQIEAEMETFKRVLNPETKGVVNAW